MITRWFFCVVSLARVDPCPSGGSLALWLVHFASVAGEVLFPLFLILGCGLSGYC